MKKQIFIINGTGTCGKDSFVKMVNEALRDIDCKYFAVNYSSITKVREVARLCGWDDSKKTEKDRKFLSDLKLLLTEYNDLPFKDMKKEYEYFTNNPMERAMLDFYRGCDVPRSRDVFLFFHIREPEEIARAVKEFNAKTILVKRDSIKHITSNMADANVYNYDYDIVVENNGTLDDLRDIAKQFVKDHINNELKNKY